MMGKNANKNSEMLIMTSILMTLSLSDLLVEMKYTMTAPRRKSWKRKNRKTDKDKGLKAMPSPNCRWV
jgi:hypothetical protein